MRPILVDLTDSIKVYSFGAFLVLGFLSAALFARRRAQRQLDADGEQVFNLCFLLFFLGLFGARLLYVLIHYPRFVARPFSFLYVWEGGLVLYGGMITCLLYLALRPPRRPGVDVWALLDILALATCLALFVGRWGTFLSGENYGTRAPDLAWAVRFPPDAHSQVPPSERGIPLHPTQIYHSLHALVLFLLLGLVARRRLASGTILGLFLVLYALGRPIIELWRGDDEARGMLLGDYVSITQALSVPIFLAGLTIVLVRRARHLNG